MWYSCRTCRVSATCLTCVGVLLRLCDLSLFGSELCVGQGWTGSEFSKLVMNEAIVGLRISWQNAMVSAAGKVIPTFFGSSGHKGSTCKPAVAIKCAGGRLREELFGTSAFACTWRVEFQLAAIAVRAAGVPKATYPVISQFSTGRGWHACVLMSGCRRSGCSALSLSA
jgi:hypothetical protein